MADKEQKIKTYSNWEITIVWKPELCQKSGKCYSGLVPVFDPRRKPWIMPEFGTTEQIIEQIKKCPSGALSYYMNNEPPTAKDSNDEVLDRQERPAVFDNNPVSVYLNKGQKYHWCACGLSSNQPFCDGSHKDTIFKPLEFEVNADGYYDICNCKNTKNPPFCDDSHLKIKDND
jgi:uncharacterized Fe-S cluster protein YjdI/CDGSH-type Zn-finger protein